MPRRGADGAPDEVAAAMRAAAGLDEVETRVTRADNEGARIVVTILNSDATLA